ncbi:MAG: NAD(P)-dependent glycerol-3-phosphate dehydrogenase [Rhodospirillales bacterium]|nr:NAD(P)-dependent glycerol-3-phosphate dehydrogenase [Rhodospirillales bacterium]
MTKIGVIGAGAWGTALAHVFANEGKDVTLWGRTPEIVATIEALQENDKYLPGVRLNETLKVTESLTRAADADVILLVTPAQHVRKTLEALKADVGSGKPVVICSKGIELESGLLMTQVARSVIPNGNFAILTGPTFAMDIARGSPSAVTLAADNKDLATELVDRIALRILRPYICEDLIGAQIGGAVKNVIAIACGAVIGRGLGESSRAALVTRGLAEMGRLASAMGAKRETLMGMCGVGDLLLTCSSMQSRNYSFGVEIGQGKSPKDILAQRKSVTEGFHTAKALMTLARKNAVEMPICQSVYECLNEDLSFKEAVEKMLDRPVSKETV